MFTDNLWQNIFNIDCRGKGTQAIFELLTFWLILLALIIDAFSVSNLVFQKMVQHASSYIKICFNNWWNLRKRSIIMWNRFFPNLKNTALANKSNRYAFFWYYEKSCYIYIYIYIYVNAAILPIKNYPSLRALFNYTFNSYIYNFC